MNLYDFIDLFPTKMLERGYYYFKNNKIKLEKSDKGIYQFSCEGQSIYEVKAELDNDYNILSYSCSCPYHQSECKHVASALYLLSRDLLDEEHEEIEYEEDEDIFMDYRETIQYASKLNDRIKKYIGKRLSIRRFDILSDQYRENTNLLLSSDDSSGFLQSVLREIFDILEHEVIESIQAGDSNIGKEFEMLLFCAKRIHSDFAINFYPILIHFGYDDLYYKEIYSFFEQKINREGKKIYGIYTVGLIKELQYDLIKRFKPTEIKQFLINNQQFAFFYLEYADLLAQSNINEAIDYLNKGLKIFEQRGNIKNIEKSLMNHYMSLENWSEVKRLGVELIGIYDFDLFYKIKACLNKEDWNDFVATLIKKNDEDFDFLAKIYNEEKMFDWLLEVISRKPYLILSYNSSFDSLFLEERNGIYSNLLLKEIDKANTRNQYRKLAWMIKNYMKAFPDNYVDVSNIGIAKYTKRVAMIDEFQKIVKKNR
ncbi:MAG: hypothetical protein Q7I99_03640 [Acholeplasmataceae bacterium]|nr:hypothetical protein [Acholeplasmataceae bacterium]